MQVEDSAPVPSAKRQKANPLCPVLDDDKEDIADDIKVPDDKEDNTGNQDNNEDIPGDERPVNDDDMDGNPDPFSSNGASVSYITSTPLFDLPIQSAQDQCA